MRTLKKFFISTIVATGLLFFSPTASHAIIGIGGVGELGSFSGTLEYFFLDENNATLEITLTNTSPAANGGYITAIAYDIPDDFISAAVLTTASNIDTILGGPSYMNSVSVSPYGARDIGAGLGDNWQGAGVTTDGMAVGDTEVFLFTFTGDDLDQLSDSSFENFIVRFRGFEDGDSDKVTDGCKRDCGEPVVPEPATLALFGGGLLAGAIARRKKRS